MLLPPLLYIPIGCIYSRVADTDVCAGCYRVVHAIRRLAVCGRKQRDAREWIGERTTFNGRKVWTSLQVALYILSASAFRSGAVYS